MVDRNLSCTADVPNTIFNKTKKLSYARGPLLGKGGFGKCFELENLQDQKIYAGKVVSKSILENVTNRKKMIQEVTIHKTLSHPNIVKFIDFFEDSQNVYIILEVCKRRSMSELLRRRRKLTVIESRYFTHSISQALKYLHDLFIIHRDLKLGNVFLTERMQVKLGDFGLSTKVIDGVPKRTMCGTPNYIAPEILNKKGHSFKVDSWSLGCLLYTMLVGKPPFDTNNVESTYNRIHRNEFAIPTTESTARTLVLKLLQSDPAIRYSVAQTLKSSFLEGFIPKEIPTSSLTITPRFEGQDEVFNSTGKMVMVCGNDMLKQVEIMEEENLHPTSDYLVDLHRQIGEVIDQYPKDIVVNEEDAEDPSCVPVYFVSRWIDYSDLYGFGYELSDGSIGILFNDKTMIIYHADKVTVQFIDDCKIERFFNIDQVQPDLAKKVAILKHFVGYINTKLVKTGADLCTGAAVSGSRMPYMVDRFRNNSFVAFSLSNGIVQINFLEFHEKLILCPLVGGVTFIDENKVARSYKFGLIIKYGCSKVLLDKLYCAKNVIGRLISRANVN